MTKAACFCLLLLGGGTLEIKTAAWVPTLSQRRVSIEMPSSTRLLASNNDPTENADNGSQEKIEPPVKEETTTTPPTRRQRQEAPALSSRDLMRSLGTSPRRIFVSFLSASGIALAGNFLGVTSNILTAVPEDIVESTGLDTYFPRGELRQVPCFVVSVDYCLEICWKIIDPSFTNCRRLQKVSRKGLHICCSSGMVGGHVSVTSQSSTTNTIAGLPNGSQ